MTAEEYFSDWSKVIDIKEAKHLIEQLHAERVPICPTLKNVFKAFKCCAYNNLRVVILGQDPYPQKGIATGIAFANAKKTPKNQYSSSLRILTESVINFTVPHNPVNFDPSLEKWEEQGVLLLNSALTCALNRPGSHILLWRPFIASFLRNLSAHKTGIIYVLMGSVAQSFRQYIDCRFNYLILTHHPAYFARTGKPMPHSLWRSINEVLIGQNGYGINWYEEEQ